MLDDEPLVRVTFETADFAADLAAFVARAVLPGFVVAGGVEPLLAELVRGLRAFAEALFLRLFSPPIPGDLTIRW